VSVTVAGDDVDPVRGDPLEARQPRRVEADLDEGAALDRASQLRVDDLVAPRAEGRAGSIYPDEEVGVAEPTTVEEGRLVDRPDAGPHRRHDLRFGGTEGSRRTAFGPRELDDRPALGPQPLEEASFVLVSVLAEDLELGVVAIPGPLPETGEGAELEAGEVVAGEPTGEVGGRDDDLAVDPLHGPRLPGRRASLAVTTGSARAIPCRTSRTGR